MKDLKFVPTRKKNLRRLNEIVNDRQVSKYLTLVPPVTMKSTIAWHKNVRKMKDLIWDLIYKGEVVGNICLLRKNASPKMKHIAEMGIAIARPHWGKGFGKAAISHAKKRAKESERGFVCLIGTISKLGGRMAGMERRGSGFLDAVLGRLERYGSMARRY